MKPAILFFARDYQADLFPLLTSAKYTSLYVVLTRKEKEKLLTKGLKVAGCFEEFYSTDQHSYTPETIDQNYFDTSYFSDRYLGNENIWLRKKILAFEIKFWATILDELKPIAFINEVIAVEIAEVLQVEAQKRGIAYWAWMVSPFKEKSFYWLTSPYHGSLDPKIFETSPSEESILFAKNYIELLNSKEDVKPFYAQNLAGRNSIKKLITILRNYLYILKYYLILPLRKTDRIFWPFYAGGIGEVKQNTINYFNSFFYKYDNPDEYKGFGFVFYPLHYEPEASILYMSEFFEDQIGTIRNISKCLGSNQILIIKEHPQQPGMLLSKKFRALKERISNIIYLPAEFRTKQVISISEAIITLTSTAGWEAIVLGKPVFVLGKIFYDQYPLINKVNSFDELKVMLREGRYKVPQKEQTEKFLTAFYQYCSMGNPYPHPSLYTKENIKNLVNAIEGKVDGLKQV